MKRVLVGGHVLLPNGKQEIANVALEGDRIVQVGRFDPASDVEIMDCQGRWVVPGFIDLHTNGAGGHDFFDEDPFPLVEERLLASGVTGYLAATVAAPEPALAALLGTSWASDMWLGFHLEGNFINPRKPGCQNPQWMWPLEQVFAWLEAARGRVRLVTVAPEVTHPATIRRLADQGVVVSIGHSEASYEEAREALLNGAKAFTHLFNANPPLHHRVPGLVGAALADAGSCCMLIADGFHVHPAVFQLVMRAKGVDKTVLVTDGTAASGAPAGSYRLGTLEVVSDGQKVALADGTLAGSCLTLDRAIHNVCQWGVSLPDALRMASEVPAQLLGLKDRGAIAPGHRADLVVWDLDQGVQATLVGGKMGFRVAGEQKRAGLGVE